MTTSPHWKTSPTLPAQQFISTYPPFEDTTWPDVITMLTEDPAENAIIEQLREAARNNELREPVVVILDEETNTWSIGNGMHRTVACVLEDKPIAYITEWPAPPADYATYAVEVLIRVGDPSVVEAVWEDAFGWLRSFPVGDTWVDSPVLGGQGNPDGTISVTGYYECHPTLEPALVEAVRAQCAHINGEVVSLTTTVVEDE